MIQRIQSVYFILIIVVNTIASYLYNKLDKIASFVADFNYEYLIYFVTVTLFSILALSLFKNRSLQMKLSVLILVLNSVVLGYLAYALLIVPGEINVSEKGVWVIIPFISIVFIVLALKGIKRDDNLVKSADRFR